VSDPETSIDKISLELKELADAYARKAAALASDPYFREAVVKASVAGFAWSLYHAFEYERAALADELANQAVVVGRTQGAAAPEIVQ